MKYIFLTAFMLALVAGLAAAPMTARYIKTDTQSYPLLISSVQVLDSSDEPMKDLSEKNFKVLVDGKGCDSLRIATYEKSGQGLHLILCIDASGTMKGAPIASIKQAVLPFLDKIRSVDKVAIATYSDDYQLLTDFTSEKELLKNTVSNIDPKGKYTSLYYGANKALQRLVNIEERTGKIMILMGDGKDENPTGSYTENDVIKLAKDNGIPIFTIGYTKVEQVYLQALERMAESTGGSYYYAPQTSDLTAHFDKLYRQIMNINLLSYIVVGIAGDGAEHNLGIQVKTDLGVKDLSAKIIAPAGKQGYQPSPASHNKKRFSPLLIGIILAAMVLITAVALLLNKRGKRKKQAIAEKFQRLEAQKNRELEAEREKRAAMEPEQQRSKTPEAGMPSPEPQVRTPEPTRPDRDRTIITGGGGGKTLILPGSDALRMEIVFGSDAGKIYTIDKSGTTIGRTGDNQIVLSDKTVSSHHAKITYVDGYFVLEDLGSTNGVFINGNKSQIYRLEGSCTFKFGGVEGNFTLL